MQNLVQHLYDNVKVSCKTGMRRQDVLDGLKFSLRPSNNVGCNKMFNFGNMFSTFFQYGANYELAAIIVKVVTVRLEVRWE